MQSRGTQALLTVEEMTQADQLTICSGIAGQDLMEAAGLSVTRHIMGRYPQGKTLVLCGPGNNGGDGFVIARHLRNLGWDVDLALLGDISKLSGDAAYMATKWLEGEVDGILPITIKALQGHTLVVDAIFGAGLCRAIEGDLAEMIDCINAQIIDVVAVDVPSGVEGNSGQIRGAGLRANSTVTFFRRKPGHILYPGRDYCGQVEVTDIGVSDRTLKEIKPKIYLNDPQIWKTTFPSLDYAGHKYQRGHAVVVSGSAASGGAARLAAQNALRIGAGLVSVSCPEESVIPHAAHLTAVMIKPFAGQGDIDGLLSDDRLIAWCVGPGNGVTMQTKSHVLKILAAKRMAVIDADGLSVFEDQPESLFTVIKESKRTPILTPHDGEFARLFPDLGSGRADYNKVTSARDAAQRSGGVIILKGPDTVIASPDGRLVINDNAPPSLATAGSGDVLAGLCLGLLAQGMPTFEAACAAVWIHGAAAASFGTGLISEDIEGQVPVILSKLAETSI